MTAPLLYDPMLVLLADAVDDLERVRVATENRLRQLTRTEPDGDGVLRGFGYGPEVPEVHRLALIVETLAGLEHDAVVSLQRQVRANPFGTWIKATVGIGEKQAARLLAAIGDPYWNTLHGRPRTVSELWAYCGLHVLAVDRWSTDTLTRPVDGQATDPAGGDAQVVRDAQVICGVAARRRKGVKSNWSVNAKTRAYLIATSCIRQAKSPYRAVYDARRAHTAITHPEWTAGHSHSDGLRIVSKAMLRDLWREAKRLHEQHQAGMSTPPNQVSPGADPDRRLTELVSIPPTEPSDSEPVQRQAS